MAFLNCKDDEQLRLAGYELVNPPEMFRLLMISTFGDPCTTGCAYFKDGKCPAYLKFHTKPQEEARLKKLDYERSHSDQSDLIKGQWKGMTIRQIAAKENISLNEARRRKQEGRYMQ